MTKQQVRRALEALYLAADLIDDYVDVVDGDYGAPKPNKAMRAHQRIEDAIAVLEDEQRLLSA